MSVLLVAVAGVAVGAGLGLTGAGGALLAVPALVYVAGVPIEQAVGIALVGVAVAAAGGLIPRIRASQVDWRMISVLASAGIPGTVLGARLNDLATTTTLSIGFAAAIAVAVATMLWSPGRSLRLPVGRRWLRGVVLIAIGVGIGVLTGFLGVGGGFLIVPTLLAVTDVPLPRIVGVSLGVIAVNSVVGVISHADGGDIGLTACLVFGSATLVSSVIASQLGSWVSDNIVRRAFCGAAGVACVAMTASVFR
ncbi:sulfite exporter TauE/SafE family protein [Gordonia hongkongensis]|uniref:sulfite exporter TauE/SafE family protein n=1 Tax=Gordonia hongkongensis TaxID=1701090 RepID=UPI0030D06382